MALDMQQSTRATHPHPEQDSTCRPHLLHLTAPLRKHSVSPLHAISGTQPADIDATISYLLSRLPTQQTTCSDVTQANLAPMIEMHGFGHFPRPNRDCLPAIAPRKRKSSPSSDSSRNVSLTSKSVAGVSRTRLPPRSRFGCWTCRTRKVKCDEARPKCSPCTRLGHRCDYNPRLSFKDDTPRVVEKMQHLTGQPEEVWTELLYRFYESQLSTHRKHDFLPPFSTLTNDEDREKKAEFRPPGSYNVIVTPSSLAGLEEYKENHDRDQTPVTGGSKSSKNSLTDLLCQDLEANVITFKDPDTVMLRVFEDNTKKLSLPNSPSSRFGPSSSSSITSPSPGHFYQRTDMFTPPPLTFEIKPQDNRDWPLICHYRNILSRHLFHVHRGSITPALAPGAFFTQELFERTVATFRPLYHALMALCALGIAHRSGIQNLDSLQHYQQALPCLQKTLRSPEDLSSDGALLTHFILLLYEIAAAAPRSSNLWSQHLNQLLRIFVLRSEMYETEPYSFLLWWVCNIDTHALICGTSDGELVDAMLQYNLFPTADNIVQLNGTGECYDPLTEEATAMPAVLNFNRKIEILTCRLGLLRRNLHREAESFARQGIKMSKSDLLERQRRVTDIQDALRRTWADQMPPSMVAAIRNDSLPTRARGIFDNSYVLYRACIIYSYTSMYPSQRRPPSPYMIPSTISMSASLTSQQFNPSSLPHPGNHYHHPPPPISLTDTEITLSAHEILHLTRSIIASGHHELRFAVFPLFMAGYVLPVQERGLALKLMEGMEMESIGRNTRATRELLEDVFERGDRGEGGGKVGASGVDWIGVLGERGLQLI